jgi:transposase
MSVHPEPILPVPEETARVAHAAFPKGTTYTRMRDQIGVLWQDEDFAGLFPTRGQPALAPWRLALVTVMQFAENLSDRQAAAKPFAPASTGSMPSAWSSQTRASTSRS